MERQQTQNAGLNKTANLKHEGYATLANEVAKQLPEVPLIHIFKVLAVASEIQGAGNG